MLLPTNTVGVYIGRFQPFHNGHVHVLKQALDQCDHVIVAVGSANRYPSIKNPFSFNQRRRMIDEWVFNEVHPIPSEVMTIVPVNDYLYSEWQWKADVLSRVREVLGEQAGTVHIKLFGHTKDDSSYYLNTFPEWEYVECGNYQELNATNLRKSLFESQVASQNTIPQSTFMFLHSFKKTPLFSNLLEEWVFYEKEQDKFSDYPYPETLNFLCSDACVVCAGNVLMIRRKYAPGKGAWALPGGFKNTDETMLDGCIRELKEETNLRVPEKVLRGSIKGSKVFDSPDRTIGVSRISVTYHIEIMPEPNGTLPRCSPMSDAVEAVWVPFADIRAQDLFEDHYDIIRSFI